MSIFTFRKALETQLAFHLAPNEIGQQKKVLKGTNI